MTSIKYHPEKRYLSVITILLIFSTFLKKILKFLGTRQIVKQHTMLYCCTIKTIINCNIHMIRKIIAHMTHICVTYIIEHVHT